MAEEGEETDREVLVPEGGSVKYELPTLRLFTLLVSLLVVDMITCAALWAAGGSTSDDYFGQSVFHFTLLGSTLDTALISIARCVVGGVMVFIVEEAIFSAPAHNRSLVSHKRQRICCQALLLCGLAACVAYGVAKAALVKTHGHTPLSTVSWALLIFFPAVGLLELLLAASAPAWVHRTLRGRVRHVFDAEGRELGQDGQPKPRGTSLARIITLARPELKLLLLGSVALLFAAASQMAAPLFFGKVVDAAQHSMHELNKTVLTMFLIYVGGAVAAMLRSYSFTLAGQRLVARLRTELLTAVIRQDVAFFDTNRTGELTNRLSSDTQVLQNALTANVSMLVRYSLQVVGSLAIMLALNPPLTGVLLAVVPVISLGSVQYGKYVRRFRKDFQDKLADANTIAEESISGLRTVRSFAGEERCAAEYNTEIQKSYQIGKKLALAEGSFVMVAGLLVYSGIALALWYGGKLVFEGHISAGTLTAFLLYTLNVAMAFALLSSLYGDFMQAVGASTRLFELLDMQPGVATDGGHTPAELGGDVKLEKVCFTYPSRPDNPVLKEVTFSVAPGEVLALVGPSGGGKSTIVSLLERFYDPSAGHVTVGGWGLQDLDPSYLRRRLALVAQEPTLFACSIRDNIAWGRPGASLQEVEAAAKQANADSFIRTFEEGYDTKVGERGVRLSGGQKQRVAIARALLMDPVVLLLDEATSALDAESEHLVQEAIERAMKGRTVIVIAHRLSTVRSADKVLVIDGGRVVERGNHETLLAAGGVYKRLVLRQLTHGAVEANGGSVNASAHDTSALEDSGSGADDDDFATVAGEPLSGSASGASSPTDSFHSQHLSSEDEQG